MIDALLSRLFGQSLSPGNSAATRSVCCGYEMKHRLEPSRLLAQLVMRLKREQGCGCVVISDVYCSAGVPLCGSPVSDECSVNNGKWSERTVCIRVDSSATGRNRRYGRSCCQNEQRRHSTLIAEVVRQRKVVWRREECNQTR